MQILADILQKEIEVTQENMTLLGNAILGATGAGFYKNLKEAFNKMKAAMEVVEPIEEFDCYKVNYTKYNRLYEAEKRIRGVENNGNSHFGS